MTRILVKNPQEFLDQGFSIPDPFTLVGTKSHLEKERYLVKLAGMIPEMRDGILIPWRRREPFDPITPRPYQLRYAAMCSLRRINVLGHEAGSGKTLTTILAMYGIFGRQKFLSNTLKPGVIHILSTSISLEITWLTELTRCGLGDYAQVITSEHDLINATKPIFIYTYDFLKQQTKRGSQMRKDRRYRSKQEKGAWTFSFVGHPMYKMIRKRFKPLLLVVDEIHRLRPDTDRTHVVKELRKGVRWFIGLTGTPIDGWVDHLAAIFDVAYQSEKPWFPYTLKGFEQAFTHSTTTSLDYVTGQYAGQARRVVAPGVPQHLLPKFYNQVGSLMHRLLFEDPEVRPHVKFPDPVYKPLYIPLDSEHKELYNRVYRGVRAELEHAVQLLHQGRSSKLKTRSTILPMLTLLRQVVAHPWDLPEPYKGGELRTSAKLRRLIELVQEYRVLGRKVVIFTNFVATGRRIVEALAEAGITSHRVYANDPQARPRNLSRKRREDAVLAFLDDDEPNPMVANLEIMAESLTLSEAASVVIHFDHSWKSYLWEQGNKRVVRPGQFFDLVPVYDLVGMETIETYVYHHVLRKIQANQRSVDRKFNESPEEVSGTIELLEQLLKEGNPEPDANQP